MAYTTINKSTDYFNTVLYTGDGNNSKAITGVGFQPDWVWLKRRDSAASHNVTDAVRGVNKTIYPSNTSAQLTDDQYGYVSAFQSDGFTIGINGNAAAINANGSSMVSWNWKAGGGAGSANTDGSINSTVSANTTAGFSIVKWTGNGYAGATVGHGLGATPAMIILKITSSTGDWLVYHNKNTSSPETEFLRLSTDAATQDELTIWNDQAPTNQVFYLGSESTVNGNGNNFIAYCFAEKTGYSRFGSYTGNGSSDGAFIYTGFKPAWIMAKNSDAVDHWVIFDTKRGSYNQVINPLFSNLTNAEGSSTSYAVDILSNGFKVRGTDGATNSSGNVYIYMAFAEAPLVGSNNIPATAR